LNSSPLASTNLIVETGINNQQIVQVEQGANLFLASVNNIGNMDIFKLNSGTFAVDAISVNNAFTLNTHDSIKSLSIDVQSVGLNLRVIAAAISKNGGGDRDLAMAIFDGLNLSSFVEIEKVSADPSFLHFVEDLDQVKVVADPTVLGSSFVTLTTNTSAAINPSSAYMIKVNNISGNTTFNFQEYNYPKLNIDDVVIPSAIAVSPIINLAAIGHLTAPVATNILPAPAEDGVINPLFFSFHEADTGDKVRSGFIHTDTTSITTDSTAVSGNFPGFIGNN
jgi:hypothetical protein